MKTDGHLAVEPSIGGRCSDLVPAVPAGKGVGVGVSTPAFCELCQDLPIATGATFRLPCPVQTQVLLLAVPAMVVHPLLQPLALAAHRTDLLAPPLSVPSAARIALRSTVLLI